MLRKLLEISRFLMVLPIVGSLILTLSVVISGLGMVLVKEWELVQEGEYSARTAKQLTLTVIEAIDMFLVGAISYLIAVGLYSLFIGDKEDPLFKRFEIGSLADLENKVIGVVVVAMAVGFVGKASDAPGAVAVMQIGAGIAVVIVALTLFVRFSSPPTEKKQPTSIEKGSS